MFAKLPRDSVEGQEPAWCSAPEQPPEIIGEGQAHQQDDEHQTHRGESLSQLERQRPANHPLRQQEQELSSVQYRYGKEVQNGKIDRDQCHEAEERIQTHPGALAGKLPDQNRPAHVSPRYSAAEQSPYRSENLGGGPRGRSPSLPQSLSQIELLGDQVVPDRDPHAPDGLGFPIRARHGVGIRPELNFLPFSI